MSCYVEVNLKSQIEVKIEKNLVSSNLLSSNLFDLITVYKSQPGTCFIMKLQDS